MRNRLLQAGVLLFSLASVLHAIELTVAERSGIGRINESVTCGVPLPVSWVNSTDELVLRVFGEIVPCEFREVAHWPDGSIRWVHLDFQASVEANARLSLWLDKGTPAQFDSRLEVVEEQGKVTVSTGRIRAEVLAAGFNVFNSVWIDTGSDGDYDKQLVSTHDRGLVMWAEGQEYLSSADQNTELTVESQGTMRVVLKAEGDLKSTTGATGFHFICRLYFFNNSPLVRLAYTFENRSPYLEGREDMVTLEGLHVELPTADSHSEFFLGLPDQDLKATSSEAGGNQIYLGTSATNQLIYYHGESQDNVGNPKALKTDRIGWIGMDVVESGQVKSLVGMGLQDFWQMHPSTLEVDAETGLITAGLIPYRLDTPIDIYSGVARTHYLRFVFLHEEEASNLGKMLAACQKPLLAIAEPEYYCRDSNTFGKIMERNPALYPPEHLEEVQRVERELDLGLEDQLRKLDNRTKNDVTWESYGFLNWGDGMHYAWEPGVHVARNIAWNHHYYDLPHMSSVEFVRTGDYRWLDYFLSRAHHLMDVHMVHFGPGKYLNGANRYCPPTDHVRRDPTDDSDYTTAPVYVSPYTNHHKTQGLFERWYFTGDERSLDCALRGAEFARSFGGYPDYKQPRGAAFQVLTLLAAYQCTGDDKYLLTAKTTFDTWYSYFRSTSIKFTQGYFMVGFLLEAFIDYYEISGDSNVVDFVKQAVDWMRANRPEEKYSNMAHGIGFLAAQLEDPSYTTLQKEYLTSWYGTWSNAYKDFGLNGRSLARALYYLSYEGQGYELRMTGDYDDDEALTISDLVALLVKGMQDESNPEIDFNRDGKYSIMDALALLIYIRGHSAGVSLAAAGRDLNSKFRLTPVELAELLEQLVKLDLTESEWEALNSLLDREQLPRAFTLSQNRPNPFNPTTTISFGIPQGRALEVKLVVYNLRAMLVKVLVEEVKEPGYYSVLWDGTDNQGKAIGSGVYFYRLSAGDFSAVRKMVLMK